jgi:hypothetical protein
VVTIASVANFTSSSACSVTSKGSTSSIGRSLFGRVIHFVHQCSLILRHRRLHLMQPCWHHQP